MFYGWYVVGACVVIILYAGGVVHFGFTAVFEPIAREFGWSYAQISLASSLRGLEMGLLAPLMGLLVDRWGPRRLVLGGSIMLCLGFAVLSRVSSLATFYGAFALMSIGMSTCTGTVLMTAAVNWFRMRAGLVTGIVASGFGLGGLLMPLVTSLIDALQWRTAMLVAGLGVLVIILPLALLVRDKPERYGYQPDGMARSASESVTVPLSPLPAEIDVPARQALKDRAFWHVAIASMCHAFVVGAVVTHMMPYLSSLGVSRSLSSLVALLLPVSSICGRLGGGWLGDRLGRKRVFTAGFACMVAGLLCFANIGIERVWLVAPFVAAFSLGWGFSVTARIALMREYFGRSSFGTILGFTSGIMMLGNVSGTPLAGWVFDTWGSYLGAWLGFGVVAFLGAVLSATARAPLRASATGAVSGGSPGRQQPVP